MYLSIRGSFIRNVAAAVVNGAITLAILLIAPLGLASVITNTALITISTFLVCTVGDLIVVWLLNAAPRPRKFPRVRDRYYDDFTESGHSIQPRYEDED